MEKNYWLQKWQSRDIGFNQSESNKLLQRYFSSLNLKPDSRIFVPLCGQSVDMLWLAAQGCQVVGVELSQIACAAFFNDNQIPFQVTTHDDFDVYQSENITIFCGDFFKTNRNLLGVFDAVYDRAALIALPGDMRSVYAAHLTELAKPEAVMFLITTVYNQNDMNGPPFSVDEDEIRALYSTYFDLTLLYSKQIVPPAHLKTRGMIQATEQAWLLKVIRPEQDFFPSTQGSVLSLDV